MAVNFLQVEKDLKIKRLFLCLWLRYSKALPMFSKRGYHSTHKAGTGNLARKNDKE